MTGCELVDRYPETKIGVRQSTKQGICYSAEIILQRNFSGKNTIRSGKTSDAKFIIKLQQGKMEKLQFHSYHPGCATSLSDWQWMMTSLDLFCV